MKWKRPPEADDANDSTAETFNLPISVAACRVIKEIEDYRKVIGLKKELSRLSAQIYAINQFT